MKDPVLFNLKALWRKANTSSLLTGDHLEGVGVGCTISNEITLKQVYHKNLTKIP